MIFKTPYANVEDFDHHGKVFTMPSLASQDEKDDVDINNIVQRYCDGSKGIATLDLGNSAAYAYLQFGDATLPGDYSTALDLVQGVREEFYELPAKLRAEFGHDPMNFVERMNDPATIELLQRYGVLESQNTTSRTQTYVPEKQQTTESNISGENSGEVEK